jgi:hypothetical protein
MIIHKSIQPLAHHKEDLSYIILQYKHKNLHVVSLLNRPETNCILIRNEFNLILILQYLFDITIQLHIPQAFQQNSGICDHLVMDLAELTVQLAKALNKKTYFSSLTIFSQLNQ